MGMDNAELSFFVVGLVLTAMMFYVFYYFFKKLK